MKNEKYEPNKEKMKMFVDFITINPNGNYQEYTNKKEITQEYNKMGVTVIEIDENSELGTVIKTLNNTRLTPYKYDILFKDLDLIIQTNEIISIKEFIETNRDKIFQLF